ncbi:hypothetical protein M405DRAFT_835475 [Rhizopogon salebrosus TDB-379]|nr:hypothetical protein M405DRAFT_835475 [Rhizopogon salebrosus TDB-379]
MTIACLFYLNREGQRSAYMIRKLDTSYWRNNYIACRMDSSMDHRISRFQYRALLIPQSTPHHFSHLQTEILLPVYWGNCVNMELSRSRVLDLVF